MSLDEGSKDEPKLGLERFPRVGLLERVPRTVPRVPIDTGQQAQLPCVAGIVP